MKFTDDPNEDDSGNPTGPPAEPPEDGAPPVNPFFVVNMMIYAIIGLLILIFCISLPFTRRQNPGITLGRLEEALPFVGSLTQGENQTIQQQTAQEEAAQGSQDSQVQGLPQAQEEAQEEAQGLLQAEAPRDSNVTLRLELRNVTWNASVAGGNESYDAAARASDDADESVGLEEDQGASACPSPRDLARDEELDQQDECAQNVFCSGHTSLRNDGSCTGATSLPNGPSKPPSGPSQPPSPPSKPPSPRSRPTSAEAVLRSDREASDLRDVRAKGAESLTDQSMSVRNTAEKRRQQNTEDDMDEKDEQEEGPGDEGATGQSSWEEESLDDEQFTLAAEECRRYLRRRKSSDEDDKE